MRWNFQKEKTYSYSYAQQVKNRTLGSRRQGEKKNSSLSKMKGVGDLLVKSKGDGAADLVLKLSSMEMEVGGQTRNVSQGVEPMVIKGMNEAGEPGDPEFKNTQRELLMKLLFPIPSGKIQKGDTVRMKRKVPFNAMGSMLYATGHSEITFTKMVTIEGNRCIQLDVVTDISNLDVPDEMEGEYGLSVTGKSRYYFDVENRIFHSGRQALLMVMKTDAPIPVPEEFEEKSKKMPDRMEMEMVNDNLIEIKRKN